MAVRRGVERESPLLLDRAERTRGARRNHEDVAALLEKLQRLERKRRFAELLFDQCDGASHALRGNVIFGEPLDGAQGDEIAKAVETLSPARLGTNQPEPFPIAQAIRIHSEDASHFLPRIPLRQAWRFLSFERFSIDYAPYVNATAGRFSTGNCGKPVVRRCDYQKTTRRGRRGCSDGRTC